MTALLSVANPAGPAQAPIFAVFRSRLFCILVVSFSMNRRFFAAACLLLFSASLGFAAGDYPRPMSALKIGSPSGVNIDLKQYKGKVLVVAMIMTHCPHCQAAVRILSKLQTDLGPKGLQVVVVAMDLKPLTVVPDFIKKFNPPFPVGFADYIDAARFMSLDTSKQYYVPYLSFVDRQGMIRAQFTGKDEINAEATQAANYKNAIEKMLAGKSIAAK